MRVYLDTNVYNRPFDDQLQPRIREESLAFIEILEKTLSNDIELVASDILLVEIKMAPKGIREALRDLSDLTTIYVKNNEKIKKLAKTLVTEAGVKSRDAIHLASAFASNTDYFITCDDGLINKKGRIEILLSRGEKSIRLLNPVEFVDTLWS